MQILGTFLLILSRSASGMLWLSAAFIWLTAPCRLTRGEVDSALEHVVQHLLVCALWILGGGFGEVGGWEEGGDETLRRYCSLSKPNTRPPRTRASEVKPYWACGIVDLEQSR